ncbi:MAG: tRNA (adenosine(37)-N6)-dimethylallyltransferase MiaA [Clostridia bacterium]|nr:tRNA (adenosine(37)-N6)-dimethylallyltransferase MiaA [Clostridia bacterium]
MTLEVVIGPTASGKSAYALSIAKRIGGEIISGDSMQIYRGMDIGTAKPAKEEMAEVPHHLIDVADISEPFSAVKFVSLARKAIEDVASRGKIPIIAGGTGLYIDMLINGTSPVDTDSDPDLRAQLYAFAEEHGADALHEKLAKADPEAASAIHPNNVKRVVRAIEIYELSGVTKTDSDRRSRDGVKAYDAHVVMLAPKDRDSLYKRIGERVDKMIASGLEDEVRRLCGRGLRSAPTAAQAIGYKEFYPMFDGLCGIGEVVNAIKLDTRHYAKRQLTWFSRVHKDEVIEV